MFARKNRISKQKEFDNIFKNGKTIKSGFFKIIFLENTHKINRFSVVVNKKVSKNAILRNKIKRRIRKDLGEFEFNNKSFDILLIVFPSILDNLENIGDEIKKSLHKI